MTTRRWEDIRAELFAARAPEILEAEDRLRAEIADYGKVPEQGHIDLAVFGPVPG